MVAAAAVPHRRVAILDRCSRSSGLASLAPLVGELVATKIFFQDDVTAQDVGSSPWRGTNDVNLIGNLVGWAPQGTMSPTPYGSSGPIGQSCTSVTGPTAGIEMGGSGDPIEWVTPPVDQAVTISGTVTMNLWGLEASMNANAGFQMVVERLNSQGYIVSTILNSERGTELASSGTPTVNNWTATPTSTALAKGDRLRLRICFNDAGGTMAAGFDLSLRQDGLTPGADGDSYIQFTETFGFMGAPAGSTLYLTSTSAGINPGAATELEAWTSRGGGSVNSTTNTVTGFQPPIQITDTGGGALIEWYSKQLSAFTLAGMVQFNLHGFDNGDVPHTVFRGEVASCASDGSSPTVWGAAGASRPTSISAGADTLFSCYPAGADLSVTNGQRLRFRLYIDNDNAAMVTGKTVRVTYNGTTSGTAGDSFVVLPQTVTEFTGGAVAVRRPDLVTAPHIPVAPYITA
jgi:hypothetical protein